MPQLDESRRHGVPLQQHIIHPTPTHLSTVNENRSLNDDTLTNGCHTPTTDDLAQQQEHTGEESSVSCPQHLQQNNALSKNLYLDEEMSGLQSAMTKTALLHRNPVDDGEVITTEEEDVDNHSRKHVGFMNGGSADNFHRQQHLSAQSATIKTDTSSSINGEISLIPDDDDKLTANQSSTEKSQLIQQLNSLRRKRAHLEQNISPILSQQLNEWNLRLLSSQHSHQIALSTLEEVSAKKIWCEEEYQLSNKWHVLGDVFLIWHRGPFGTINGFRLGKSAVTIVGLVKKSARGGGGSQGNARQTGGASSLFSWGATSDNNGKTPASNAIQTSNNVAANNGNNKTNNSNATTSPEKVIIPWNEINSALGQIVFLLYTLQNAPYSGISFQKHILQPCGSSSKIGVIKKTTDQQPRNERRRITALTAYYNNTTSTTNNAASTLGDVTWYNLHHYEENGSLLSMGYYARRNFNTALEGLLYCIAEAFLIVEQRDMALAAPYIMKVDGLVVGKDIIHGNNQSGMVSSPTKDGEVSVGGLPLTYDPAAGEQWTVVCKYLLTNLKWLVAYGAKHVDR